MRGCRAVEREDGGAEEVGSWLRRRLWDVVGESGGCLRLWFGFLVRARCCID